MLNELSFKTRARLINQLGEQLIKSESIALLELIKNSYDADASICTVTMDNPDSSNHGRIVIRDDGEGMDYKTLTTVWLEIGTSYREDVRKSHSTRRSEKYKRLPLGEKGIGRLGAHRLGHEIQVVTRKNNAKEVVLYVNWDEIAESKYIEDLPVFVNERNPEVLTNGSGTVITINRLRTKWDRKMARDCARAINSLNSPFESDDSFRVSFSIQNNNWLDNIITFRDIEDYMLYSFDLTMNGMEITKFKYQFLPWSTMKKLSRRSVTLSDKEFKHLVRMKSDDGLDIDLSKFRIGPVRFRGHIFDRDPRTLALGVQDKKGFKEYLDENGGIQVFRDNMRVLDYGDPNNDWLDLGAKRVNNPGFRLSNKLILGAVYLDRGESQDLKEKANREGFVENQAYHEFWQAVRFGLERVESLRKIDKDLLRKHYGPQEMSEPVRTSISELKAIVEKDVSDAKVRSKISRHLDRIDSEYDEITDSLIRSAGAGLNLTVVIHQIEKIIKDIASMIQTKAKYDLIEDRVAALTSLVEGYSILVRKSEKKRRDLRKIIEQGLFNMSFRLKAHKIVVDTPFRDRHGDMRGVSSESHVLNALMNLLDNSIWWLGYSETKSPSILIDLTRDFSDHLTIIVADNGPGFTKPTDEIIKPFVSYKPGGMGIGLHLTHEIMESLGGQLIFPDKGDFDIPAKYKRGAIIALAFRQE
jgi:signal transduction histidine kinase